VNPWSKFVTGGATQSAPEPSKGQRAPTASSHSFPYHSSIRTVYDPFRFLKLRYMLLHLTGFNAS
jgi:hypothetical protein